MLATVVLAFDRDNERRETLRHTISRRWRPLGTWPKKRLAGDAFGRVAGLQQMHRRRSVEVGCPLVRRRKEW